MRELERSGLQVANIPDLELGNRRGHQFQSFGLMPEHNGLQVGVAVRWHDGHFAPRIVLEPADLLSGNVDLELEQSGLQSENAELEKGGDGFAEVEQELGHGGTAGVANIRELVRMLMMEAGGGRQSGSVEQAPHWVADKCSESHSPWNRHTVPPEKHPTFFLGFF